MKRLLRLLSTLLKLAFFFTLFAFALNNQHEVVVHFFFGHQWSTHLVILVLITLTIGFVLGILAMVPRWWRKRRIESNEAASGLTTHSAQVNHTSTTSLSTASPVSSGSYPASPKSTVGAATAPHPIVPPPDSIYGP